MLCTAIEVAVGLQICCLIGKLTVVVLVPLFTDWLTPAYSLVRPEHVGLLNTATQVYIAIQFDTVLTLPSFDHMLQYIVFVTPRCVM
jgi:hypothetical protein